MMSAAGRRSSSCRRLIPRKSSTKSSRCWGVKWRAYTGGAATASTPSAITRRATRRATLIGKPPRRPSKSKSANSRGKRNGACCWSSTAVWEVPAKTPSRNLKRASRSAPAWPGISTRLTRRCNFCVTGSRRPWLRPAKSFTTCSRPWPSSNRKLTPRLPALPHRTCSRRSPRRLAGLTSSSPHGRAVPSPQISGGALTLFFLTRFNGRPAPVARKARIKLDASLFAQALPGQYHRAQRAGVISETPRKNLDSMPVAVAQKIFIGGLTDRPDKIFAQPFGNATADHHALRVKEVHDVGNQDAQVKFRPRHHLAHGLVLLFERGLNHAARHPVFPPRLHVFEDHASGACLDRSADVALHRRAAGQRLRAAAVPATAKRAIHHDDRVTDLACSAPASLVQLSFDNDSSPDPCAAANSHQVARALTGPQRVP